MKPLLSIENISKTYFSDQGETQAIKDFTLQVKKGEFISIVGPSGCGKSTLLSLIAELIEPTDGEVELDKTQVSHPQFPMGYMFQRDHLFEWRTIEHNMMLGLEIRNKLNEEHIEYVNHLIDTYGLHDFRHHYPSQISGGMRQRAALIRTLALQPEILLLDEPFSALDYITRLRLSDEVKSILTKEKKTALLVTHDISEAISLGDRVIILSNAPATIVEEVPIHFPEKKTPTEYRHVPEFQEYFSRIWKVMDEL